MPRPAEFLWLLFEPYEGILPKSLSELGASSLQDLLGSLVAFKPGHKPLHEFA